MWKRALEIARVRGVPLRLHVTLLFVIPYLAIQIARGAASLGQRTDVRLNASPVVLLLWGLLLSISLFASIFVHELAHVIVAQRAGGRVRGITLMLLGGISEVESVPPGHPEAKMAIVGPLTSIALGLLSLGLYYVLGAAPPLVRLFAYYLGGTNLVIGAFNLLPAFPLDGGRVLRAMLRHWMGEVRATSIAAGISKVMALGLVAVGMFGHNLLLVLVAFFIYAAGEAEAKDTLIRSALEGLRVGDLASRALPVLHEGDTVEQAREALARSGAGAVAVLDSGGPAGLLTVSDLVRAVSMGAATGETLIGALPLHTHPVVAEADDVGSVLERLSADGSDAALVVELGQPSGILRREDIARAVQLSDLFRGQRRRRPAP